MLRSNNQRAENNVCKNVVCNVCHGHGKLNQFKRQTVVEDCIYDVRVKCNHKALPLKCILKNKGNLIVNQTNKKLSAISTFPDDEIFEISDDLLKRHETRLRNSPGWELVNQVNNMPMLKLRQKRSKVST